MIALRVEGGGWKYRTHGHGSSTTLFSVTIHLQDGRRDIERDAKTHQQNAAVLFYDHPYE